MSYSTCINCDNMVSMYEKYCPKCVEKYKVQQDVNFHKTKKWTGLIYVDECKRLFQEDLQKVENRKLKPE